MNTISTFSVLVPITYRFDTPYANIAVTSTLTVEPTKVFRNETDMV